MKNYHVFPAVVFALLCLTGCAGRSPQPSYYLLREEQPVVAPLPGNRPAVVLHQFVLPSYLDRESLVLRTNDAVEIVVAAYHLWAEPLNKAAPRLLEESMRPLLQEKGLNLLWQDGVDAALQVDVALLRLDGAPGSSATISARWRIVDREGSLLAQGLFTRERNAGDSYESMVRALSRLLAEFGGALAQASGDVYDRLAVQKPSGAGKKNKE